MNGKIKHRDDITKLNRDGEIYETAQKIVEIMNETFKSVFTKEIVLVPPRYEKQLKGVENIHVERKKIN